jgi:hypothetical protein
LIARYGEPEPVETHPDTPTTQHGQSHDYSPDAPTEPSSVHAPSAQEKPFDIPKRNSEWEKYWDDFATAHPAEKADGPTQPLVDEHAPTQPLADEHVPTEPLADEHGTPTEPLAAEPEPTDVPPAHMDPSSVHDTPAQEKPFDIADQHDAWQKYWDELATERPGDEVVWPTESAAGAHEMVTEPSVTHPEPAPETPADSPTVHDTPAHDTPAHDTPAHDQPFDIPKQTAEWEKFWDDLATEHPVEEAGVPTHPLAEEPKTPAEPSKDPAAQDKPLDLPKWSDFWDSAKNEPVTNSKWHQEQPVAGDAPTHVSEGDSTGPSPSTHEPTDGPGAPKDPSSVENIPTQPLSEDPSASTDSSTAHGVPKDVVEDDPNYHLRASLGDPNADPPIDSLQVPPSYGEKVWDDVVTNLSPEHERAVKFYSASGYTTINEFLRSKDPNHPIEDAVKEHIARLAEVARMRPVPRDIDVVRGVGKDAFSVPMRKLKGTVQSDAAFMSTSLGDKAAFSYKPVILHLRVPAGTPAIYLDRISSSPGERELLLIHGRRWLPTQVEIRKNEYGEKVYHVYGKILPD